MDAILWLSKLGLALAIAWLAHLAAFYKVLRANIADSAT